ncbi:MAG: DNA primase [Planctomycetota bacterium]
MRPLTRHGSTMPVFVRRRNASYPAREIRFVSYSPADDSKERVRQATDIADLVGSYLELRRQGRNYVARCPWHDDRKPSLQVNPERQSWKCWVCNIGGDVFSFVMRREGVEFPEALRMLADRAGITLAAQRPKAATQPGSPDDKATLYQAMAWAESQFHQCLLEASVAEPARRYLDDRGITEQSIEKFRLGYAPDQWQWLVERARGTAFSEAVLEACDLIGRSSGGRTYDRFKGRVLFPIHDTQGRPIALGGRILPGVVAADPERNANAAKYINSRENPLFTKSDNLYALHLAKQSLNAKSRSIVVVEGYTDVVIAHQVGLTNVVAVLGTALNGRHIRLLRRFADTVYLVLDGDEAGQRRTNEILGLFVAEQYDLRIMTLPNQMDPADFCLAEGREAFETLLGTATDAIEHKIRVETRGLDLVNDTYQANRALENILRTIARAPNAISASAADHALWESQIINRLARQFMISDTEVRARFQTLRRSDERPGEALAADELPSETLPGIALGSLPAKERELLEILTLHPELGTTAFAQIQVEDLQCPATKKLFNTMQQLVELGEPMEFTYLLSSLEDEPLKGLLVQLDDSAREKATLASETAAQRLDGLVRDFALQRQSRLARPEISALDQKSLPFESELEVLQRLLAQERSRRGLLN